MKIQETKPKLDESLSKQTVDKPPALNKKKRKELTTALNNRSYGVILQLLAKRKTYDKLVRLVTEMVKNSLFEKPMDIHLVYLSDNYAMLDLKLTTFAHAHTDYDNYYVRKYTTNDNSLFNTASLMLVGTEKLCKELRVRSIVEMILYRDYYERTYNSFSSFGGDYETACLLAATEHEHLSIWLMPALATVIQRPISSVYANFNSRPGATDSIYDVANVMLLPRAKSGNGDACGENLYLLWTGIVGKKYVPNYVSPLIKFVDPSEKVFYEGRKNFVESRN